MPCFPVLTSSLSELCFSSFAGMTAALCLSKLCVSDDNARHKLRDILKTTEDTHIRNQVQEMMVCGVLCTGNCVWRVVFE